MRALLLQRSTAGTALRRRRGGQHMRAAQQGHKPNAAGASVLFHLHALCGALADQFMESEIVKVNPACAHISPPLAFGSAQCYELSQDVKCAGGYQRKICCL